MFEWDPVKARQNLQKHRVSFDGATTTLLDPLSKTALDPYHSVTEHCYLTFGLSWRGRLLVVSYTERRSTIRIISARIATRLSERFMKKITGEIDDWLLPEYERSDLGELVQGKYAFTQVDFAELVKLTVACIGEDEGVRFEHHSPGNNPARHKAGDWTYEIDTDNQITLRFGSVNFEVLRNRCLIQQSSQAHKNSWSYRTLSLNTSAISKTECNIMANMTLA